MNPSTPITSPPENFTAIVVPTVGPPPPGGEPATPELYERIAQQPFFAGLSAEHLKLLAAEALEVGFEAGEVIFQEGSPANRFFLIVTGKVVLESESMDRGAIAIQTLGPGDDLGWSWLFPPYHLHLSARALEPTRAISFFGTRLREQCDRDHHLGYELMKRITEVAIKCLQAMRQRLMECTPGPCPTSELIPLAGVVIPPSASPAQPTP